MMRIVYTRVDGGVSVCIPDPNCLRIMTGGGKGEPVRGWCETQIERRIAEGRNPDGAARFVRAVAFGGLTTAEALAAIRDCDALHLGSGHELWTPDELPDRWFRDAWRRSGNGGPIRIDLDAARPIQWRQLRQRAREATQDDYIPDQTDWGRVRAEIHRARDVDDLRRVGI